MNKFLAARLPLLLGAVFLFWTGISEISAQSKGADSWAEETSFAALTLRAHGYTKLGLAFGLLGASLIGVRCLDEVLVVSDDADNEIPSYEPITRTTAAPAAYKPTVTTPKEQSDLPLPPNRINYGRTHKPHT